MGTWPTGQSWGGQIWTGSGVDKGGRWGLPCGLSVRSYGPCPACPHSSHPSFQPAPPSLAQRILLGPHLSPHTHRLGRRKVLILNYLQTAVSGTCAAFAPNFSLYCVFRLLSGMSVAGITINCMTLSEGALPFAHPAFLPISSPTQNPCYPLGLPLQPTLSPFTSPPS